MLGAFVLDFFENRGILSADDLGIVAIGFVVSFVCALFVVRTLVNFVARHGFTPFAWWRVIVGVVGCRLWLSLTRVLLATGNRRRRWRGVSGDGRRSLHPRRKRLAPDVWVNWPRSRKRVR